MNHLNSGPERAGNLAAAFEAAVATHPDRPALVHLEAHLTYRRLSVRVHGAARAIAEHTVEPGALVVVALPPSVELVCAILGAVTAGAAYLPVDFATPDDYLREVIADARPALLVTTPERAARLADTSVPILTGRELPTEGEPFVRKTEPGPTDPAYVIYTSGSTGRPKGVLVGHGAMLNSTAARVAAYGVPTRMPLVHSIAFDLSSGVVFWALLGGGTLIISPVPLTDVAGTLELIAAHDITHLVYPASLYAPFLDRAALDPPTGLHHVMIGSERWSSVLIGRHAELLPTTSLHNEYGPSEACVWSSSACVYDGTTGRSAALTLGRPILNTGYLVLDEAGEPVTPGGRGELYITGRNLAIGYLRSPELTAERFLEGAGGERSYRTGDVVELTEDGEYVFVGRADRQIKVQGNRLEAGHVETLLMTHPDVRQAYVTSRNDSGLGSVLVAYLVLREGRGTAAELEARLATLLPTYMVPSAYVPMAELPRTPSGKTDERRLPPPSVGPAMAEAVPADELEAELAAAVAEILGCASVGVLTPLNELGANSLAFVRISAAVTRAYGADIPMSVLFARPTVRAIAEEVRTARPGDRPALVPVPDPANSAPLSAQQQQIWFLHHLSPDALAYNTQFSLRLTGRVEAPLLEEALSHIVARHEILRTTFHEGPDGPVQVVRDPWRVQVGLVDLTTIDEAGRRAAMDAHMRAQMTTRFDVAALPLVRWYLYRLGQDSWNLFQIEHHFVHDGWSASLFLREIRDTYDAFVRGERPALPALAVQYRDYARWYHRWRESQDFADQGEYWARQFADGPTTGVTFESERIRPARQGFEGGCLRADVPAEVVARLDELSARHGTTRFAVFLTAFALLVRHHTGERDFVIGSALSNRRLSDTAAMLGMFVNALPLRLKIDPTASVADLVQAVMRVVLGAQDHQEYPLVDIIKRLDLPRDPARNPLFQLMFAFHDSPRPTFELDSLKGELWIEHNGSAKNDLNVVCVPNPPGPGSALPHAGVNVLWEYNREVFGQETAAALLDDFIRILGSLAELWDMPVVEADLLGAEGTARILQLAQGPQAQPPHSLLHAGVEAAVRRDPQATAVIYRDQSVSYAELDRMAERLEASLAARGVGPGAVVAIAHPKSPLFVASCLAVLRRGAAYLCLDPELPRARLELILRDAAPSALLGPEELVRRLGARPVTAAAGRPDPVEVPPNGPAYLVYTSGSTGTPKAVVATHRGAVTALHARTVHFGAEPPRTLVTLPVVFDVACSMIFWTLWQGGTVVLPQEDESRDPAAVAALVEKYRVSHVNFVASFYRQFLESLPGVWASAPQVVAIGGDPCTPDVVARHAALLPVTALHNEYGPTEATVWCSAAAVHTFHGTAARRVTVGRPLAGYALYVLDGRQRLAPVGARGELHVAGPGLAAGYLNQPELTAERFVTPAAGPLAGIRLYRTGDQARLCPDGRFEVLGRLDDQVKVRGYRIETGEVRRCLTDHPLVNDAFVTVHDPGGRARLVAYAAVRCPDAAAQLREWAVARLPSYMVPAAIVPLTALPLTGTGKIDRARLPEPVQEAGGQHTAAETPLQQRLLDLWQTALGRQDIGIDDDFFQVGGDSLQSIRLATAARRQGLTVTVAQLLQARTVRGLARLVERTTPGSTAAERRPEGTELALTPVQGWFFAQEFANPNHFNQARLLTVDESLDLDVLRAAVTWTLERHEAFRTRFRGRSAVLGGAPPALRELTLAVGQGPEDLVDELHRRIDLGRHRLAEVALLERQQGPGRWLAMVLHHLIVDAVSWDVLLQDITSAARRLLAGRPLEPSPAQGVPDTTVAAAGPADTNGYWQRLAAVPKPRLPLTGAHRTPSGALGRITVRLSTHATVYLLDDVPRFHAVSTRAVLLAALHRALAPLTGAAALYAFLEGHGRNGLDGADEVVGWLTALHPVLLPGDPADSLTALATGFQRVLDAVPAGGADFGTARYLRPQSPLGELLGGLDLPQVTFNYLGRSGSGSDLLRPATAGTGTPIAPENLLPTPLDLTVVETGGRLEARFVHDDAVLGPGVAASVADRFAGLLEAASRAVALTDTPATARAPRQFLIHPVGGSVHWYLPLARALAPAWDCIGLPQSDTVADTSVPALAATYLEHVRAVQQTGPYRIVGWSFGAAVAHELACLLHEQGDEVARLTLLDPPALLDRSGADATLAGHLGTLLPGHSRDELLGAVEATRGLPAADRPGAVTELLRLREQRGPGRELDFVLRQLTVLVANHTALEAWSPRRPCPGWLDVVLSEDGATRGRETAEWLRHTSGGGSRSVIPGDHVSMLSSDGLKHLVELLDDEAARR